MIKITDWSARLMGDVILHSSIGLEGDLIRAAELRLLPRAPRDFIPSHVATVGAGAVVIEAWDSDGVDSAAALNPISKYDGEMEAGRLELWRVEGATLDQIGFAIGAFVHDYSDVPYAWPNLLGFLVEAIRRGSENPVDMGAVCSQADAVFLRYLDMAMFPNSTLLWLDSLDFRNLTPLGVRVAFLANQQLLSSAA